MHMTVCVFVCSYILQSLPTTKCVSKSIVPPFNFHQINFDWLARRSCREDGTLFHLTTFSPQKQTEVNVNPIRYLILIFMLRNYFQCIYVVNGESGFKKWITTPTFKSWLTTNFSLHIAGRTYVKIIYQCIYHRYIFYICILFIYAYILKDFHTEYICV